METVISSDKHRDKEVEGEDVRADVEHVELDLMLESPISEDLVDEMLDLKGIGTTSTTKAHTGSVLPSFFPLCLEAGVGAGQEDAPAGHDTQSELRLLDRLQSELELGWGLDRERPI